MHSINRQEKVEIIFQQVSLLTTKDISNREQIFQYKSTIQDKISYYEITKTDLEQAMNILNKDENKQGMSKERYEMAKQSSQDYLTVINNQTSILQEELKLMHQVLDLQQNIKSLLSNYPIQKNKIMKELELCGNRESEEKLKLYQNLNFLEQNYDKVLEETELNIKNSLFNFILQEKKEMLYQETIQERLAEFNKAKGVHGQEKAIERKIQIKRESKRQIELMQKHIEVDEQFQSRCANTKEYLIQNMLNSNTLSSNIIDEKKLEKTSKLFNKKSINTNLTLASEQDLNLEYILGSLESSEPSYEELLRYTTLNFIIEHQLSYRELLDETVKKYFGKPTNDFDKIYKTNLCVDLIKTNTLDTYFYIQANHLASLRQYLKSTNYFLVSDLNQKNYRTQYANQYNLDEQVLGLYINNNIVSLEQLFLTKIERHLIYKYLEDTKFMSSKPVVQQQIINKLPLFLHLPKHMNEIAYGELVNRAILQNKLFDEKAKKVENDKIHNR